MVLNGKNQWCNSSTLQVFVRSSMAKDKEVTLLHFVLEQSLFSMKEQFFSWMNAGLIKHRNPWLTEGTKGKLVNMIFKFPFSLQDEMWNRYFFLPFEVTCDITLMISPPPLFFFLTLFLLICFSARKNDIRKKTLYRLWEGQKWKCQSEVCFMKKQLFHISLMTKIPPTFGKLLYLILLPATFKRAGNTDFLDGQA